MSSSPQSGSRAPQPPRTRTPAERGIIAILLANALWGAFPLLFHALRHVPAELVVAHRIVWALLILIFVLAASGRLAEVRALMSDRRLIGRLAVSSLVLAVNWLLYVISVESGRVLEASFGYFITPLVNVMLGMVLLGERLSLGQSIAIGIAVIAVGIQAAGLEGNVPWLGLGVAFSFAIYGYLRKTIPVSSTTGLFAETAVLFLPSLGFIGVWAAMNGPGAQLEPWTLGLLVVTGLGSVGSLVAFAYGAQRLPLGLVGMFQYLAPSLQFIVAVTLLGEELNATRLFSFGLIWVSILVFSWDSLRRRGAAA